MKLNKNTKEAKGQNKPLPKKQRKLKMNDPFLKIQRKPKSRKYKRAFSERPPPSCPNALLQNTSFIRTDKSRSAFLDQNYRAELELMGLISGGLQSFGTLTGLCDLQMKDLCQVPLIDLGSYGLSKPEEKMWMLISRNHCLADYDVRVARSQLQILRTRCYNA